MDLDPNQVIAQAVVAVVVAAATAVGAVIDRWLIRRRKADQDKGAALEKIRQVQRHLGLPEADDVKCLDYLFAEIRKVEKHVGIKGDGNGDRVATGGEAGAGQALPGQGAQGPGDS